ncbi:AraC family transcriptional regulator [Pseudomonas tohonis]|uniref:AraC family transcriptional regulator n=1 Tax=Pseudomonas tohonis TaxID=2725477 RepID=A0A6J4EAQ6_9PSED|nr:AraC family transcriptional regulator [Pseudomonas tohonis]BCG26852.1 AraC family transcriptional regulator [Pseudomonas tohonis]GJN50412.1 AraC family transcriptional regulator [Pseudomonas tohonis]
MIESPWQGALWLAHDFCLIDGANGDTRPHAHYAHQVLLAREAQVHLRVEGEPVVGQAVLVESMREHALALPGQVLLAVYAEPLAFAPQALLALVADAGPDLQALAERLLAAPRPMLDARLQRALGEVDELLADKVSAQALANRACLSLSQLERLFGEQVGLSVRRLVLWRRLRLAVRLALEGQSLTLAAHGAGFADASHFSRTMRATFGIRADRNLGNLQLRLLGD